MRGRSDEWATLLIWGLLLTVGLGLRFALTLTSVGSTDVLLIEEWIRITNEHGVLNAYTAHTAVNHPPLSLMLLQFYSDLAASLQVAATDLLRIVQALCDAVTALLVAGIASRLGMSPLLAASLFFLAPTSIFVSGFHGNTDSMMMMLTCAALLAALHVSTRWSAGVLLGLACSIKIVPVLLLPFLTFARAEKNAPLWP